MLAYRQDKDYGGTAEEIIEGKKNFICEQYNAFGALYDEKREEVRKRQVEASLYARALVDIVREDMNSNPALNAFAGCDAASDFENAVLLNDQDIFKKFSQEEQKKCNDSYKRISEVVSKTIFKGNPDFTVKSVLKVDNTKAMYLVQLDYKGETLAISVPIFSNADVDNFNSIVAGYTLSVPNPSVKNSFNALVMHLDYTTLMGAYLKWYEDTFGEPKQEGSEDLADPAEPKKASAPKASKKSKAN